MLYAVLKTVHLLALIAWIGGMFFTLLCLRPALGVLDGPSRPRLMAEVLRRFFAIVNIAILSILVSGVLMTWLAFQSADAAGTHFAIPPAWHAMIVLGLVMMGLFGYISGTLFRRLRAALQTQDAGAGATALAAIRKMVTTNLVLGVIVVVAMKLGTAL